MAAMTSKRKAAIKKWQAAGAKSKKRKKLTVAEKRKKARAYLAKYEKLKAAGKLSLAKVKGLDRQGKKYTKADIAFKKKTSRQAQIASYDAAKKAARKRKPLKSVRWGF